MRPTMRVRAATNQLLQLAALLLIPAVSNDAAWAAPYVEFDFARTAPCRDVTRPERAEQYPHERLIEVTLPISVRFRGLPPDDVDELDIEISGAASGLRVTTFSPATQLATDVARAIETTTTTKQGSSLDASLGGTIPIPYAEIVAHLTPTINAASNRSESATETVSRLPPQRAVVVSGTAYEGRGVFFKLKRSSQTSLEGVHELRVSFIVPAEWQAGTVRVGCSARGQRKVFWLKQPSTLGRAAGDVRLRLVADDAVRAVPAKKSEVVMAEKSEVAAAASPKVDD